MQYVDNGNVIKKTKLLTQHSITRIGPLNTRTIRELHKRDEIFHLFENSGIDVLAIEEHRIHHNEEENEK